MSSKVLKKIQEAICVCGIQFMYVLMGGITLGGTLFNVRHS